MMIVEQIRPYRVVILLFILAAFALRIPILKVRYFDPDEFQHLHGARQIYRGQMPYRDYFEHHTPLLHFILTRFYPIFGERIRILFAFGCLIIVLAWMLLDRRVRTPWEQKLKLAGIFLSSMMVPIILTCLFFYANGGLWEFINCNFIMNSRWRVRFRPYNYIKRLLSQNPFFSSISAFGLFVGTFRMRKKEEIEKGSAVPVLCTYGLIASLFIIPVPYRQFYLLFLPLLAMYCGSVLSRVRRTYLALSIAIVIIVYPLVQTVSQLSQKNDGQLANVKYIMNITTEEDTVLDGWSGFGFLRSHAYCYFFLHSEMLAMLNEKEKSDDLINSLEEKRTRAVIYDGSIKALPKKVQEYISSKYKPSGHGNIWVRTQSEDLN